MPEYKDLSDDSFGGHHLGVQITFKVFSLVRLIAKLAHWFTVRQNALLRRPSFWESAGAVGKGGVTELPGGLVQHPQRCEK